MLNIAKDIFLQIDKITNIQAKRLEDIINRINLLQMKHIIYILFQIYKKRHLNLIMKQN